MRSLKMVLEADNVAFPSLHPSLCDNPYLLGNLINESEVMTHQH